MQRVGLLVAAVTLAITACSSTGSTTTTTDSPVTTSPVTTSPITTSPVTSDDGQATTTTLDLASISKESCISNTDRCGAGTTTTTAGRSSGDSEFRTPAEFGLAPPDPIEGSEGASGSGCSPGEPIRDGVWFGFVHDIDSAGIEIDIACFWFGETAYTVGEADGEDVANDFYVQNQNALLRQIPIGESPIVWVVAGDPTEGHSPFPYDTWPDDASGTYVPCPGESCGVWIYLNNGSITEIVEQYVP